ncbi:prolyl oligopeptidase family serine peptidase [Sphingobium sp. Sx8-8]|uniref:prolyl oligopeptidase family serine peptidase n=1 Tax=Sphingobium sp. Sx8-8 TaxID=2933617 RepID=UPI001F587FE9
MRWFAICAALSPIASASALPIQPSTPTWTVDEVLAIPEVTGVGLAHDGQSFAYILRIADIEKDRPAFELHILDLTNRRDRIVIRSTWIELVRPMPGKASWSFLADLGDGVQLYAFDNSGRVSPLVVNGDTILTGNADGAEVGYTFTGPLRIGVAFYDWSPDGQHLFYSIVRPGRFERRTRIDDEVVGAGLNRRPAPPVSVEFFHRKIGGEPIRIATAQGTDKVARFLGGLPVWHADSVDFGLQTGDRGHLRMTRYRWTFGDRAAVPLANAAPQPAGSLARGPQGGLLSVEWVGEVRHLLEHRSDGTSIDYGPTSLSISDPRSTGNWSAPGGSFTITAVRLAEAARYALLRIDRSGRTRLIQGAESLRHCDFSPDLAQGVCVNEGLTRPPRFVAVSARDGRITPIRSVSPRHDAIAPLRSEARTLTNRYGFKFRTFILYPRGFRPGKRYPAIIVNHGNDADERFAAPDMQWNYPVQVLAERGYVVALVNEPYASQSRILQAANDSWTGCDGKTAPSEVRRLIWLNAVESFRSIIAALDAESLIDPGRLGIAGYSYGSQLTNVAVTQTNLFKAASSGDGGYLEPAAYRSRRCGYGAIYGGPPSDPLAYPDYVAFAPSFRARFVSAAMLQQLAEPWEGAIDFHQALEAAGVPSEMSLYPGETSASDETHLFHIPSNQRAAMQENIAWFDFWLRDIEPPIGSDDARRSRWNALRDKHQP